MGIKDVEQAWKGISKATKESANNTANIRKNLEAASRIPPPQRKTPVYGFPGGNHPGGNNGQFMGFAEDQGGPSNGGSGHSGFSGNPNNGPTIGSGGNGGGGGTMTNGNGSYATTGPMRDPFNTGPMRDPFYTGPVAAPSLAIPPGYDSGNRVAASVGKAVTKGLTEVVAELKGIAKTLRANTGTEFFRRS